MNEKELFGILALLTALISYIFYFRSILQGVTKPHAFSWFTWGILTLIAFGVQYTHGAGAGAWSTGFVALYCFIVALLALFIGEKNIHISDWVAFVCSLLILPFWYFTKEALVAVILIVIIDALGGYYPTFRKSYYHPRQEALPLYGISIFQLMLSLLAMEDYRLVNILYPLFIIVANAAFIAMVVWRKRSITLPANPPETK